MSKHTEGPWKLTEEEGELLIETDAGRDSIILAHVISAFSTGRYYERVSMREARANGKIFTKAPEMLEYILSMECTCEAIRQSTEFIAGFAVSKLPPLQHHEDCLKGKLLKDKND